MTEASSRIIKMELNELKLINDLKFKKKEATPRS